MTDLIAHLTRQGAFGRATFGPGPRTEGVLKHIESEIEEVRRAAAEGDLDELVKEWTDIAHIREWKIKPVQPAQVMLHDV